MQRLTINLLESGANPELYRNGNPIYDREVRYSIKPPTRRRLFWKQGGGKAVSLPARKPGGGLWAE